MRESKMDEKKMMNDEELEKVTGGRIETIRIIQGVVMKCCCGAEIYDTNPTRVNEDNIQEVKCTQCGEWHRLQ